MNHVSVWAVAALATLAGCSSGDGLTNEEEAYNDLASAYNSAEARISALPSSGADTPTTGSATYEGPAAMVLETQATTQLAGRADIQVDFSDDTMSGELSDFVGQVNGGAVREFDGSLLIANGDVSNPAPGSFRAEVGGELTGGGNSIEVDGPFKGDFYTDNGQAAGALSGNTTVSTEFVLNGTAFDGALGVAATR
jgi:hypothetical protein